VLSARCANSNIDLGEVIDIAMLDREQFNYRATVTKKDQNRKDLVRWRSYFYTSKMPINYRVFGFRQYGKLVSIHDDILILTHLYNKTIKVRTYVFDFTQKSIFPLSYGENWNNFGRDMNIFDYFTSSAVVENLGDGFVVKSYQVKTNYLFNRQNRSINFKRVVCESCEQESV
jgi:hypothetical protein